MWRAAGLEEPGTKAPAGATAFNAVQGVEGTVDNTTAGGFFQRYGREPNLPGPCVNRRTVEAPDMPDARTDSAAAAGSSGGVVAAELQKIQRVSERAHDLTLLRRWQSHALHLSCSPL